MPLWNKKKVKKPEGKEEGQKKLGIRIGDIYLDSMAQVLKLVEDKPEVDVLKPKVNELKEQIIQELIPLGVIKSEMDEAQKNMVNMDIHRHIRNLEREDLQSLTDAINHYRSLDNDLANDIADFNIITQYADFELLKKQRPDEFERLGLWGPDCERWAAISCLPFSMWHIW